MSLPGSKLVNYEYILVLLKQSKLVHAQDMTNLKLFSTLFLLFLFTILFGYPSIIKLLHDDTILVEDTGNYLSEGSHTNIADFETFAQICVGGKKI